MVSYSMRMSLCSDFLFLSLKFIMGLWFFTDVAIRARIGSWQVTQLPIGQSYSEVCQCPDRRNRRHGMYTSISRADLLAIECISTRDTQPDK